jgi:hypothetical protein
MVQYTTRIGTAQEKFRGCAKVLAQLVEEEPIFWGWLGATINDWSRA